VSIPARSKPLPGILRDGPGRKHQQVASLPDGAPIVILDEIYVTEKASDPGTWYKVRGTSAKGQVVGWIHSDIVKP
jgi:hypothetical protein